MNVLPELKEMDGIAVACDLANVAVVWLYGYTAASNAFGVFVKSISVVTVQVCCAATSAGRGIGFVTP